MKRALWLAAWGALASVPGCEGPTEPPVASIAIEPAAVTLDLGFTQQFRVVLRDASGRVLPARGPYAWESMDSTIVTVDAASAQARARAPGRTTLRVGLQDLSASAEIAVPPLSFASISVGDRQICGVTTDGLAYCWGANNSGQLGNGDSSGELRVFPEPVAGGLRFQSISTAHHHTCGITQGGATYCWGWNTVGELGDGATSQENRLEPVAVAGEVKFASVHAGAWFTCGLTASGAAYCWGDNMFGSLGDGTTANRKIPAPVAGDLRFASLSAGSGHVCALTSQGTGYCWGDNRGGELGDGTTTGRSAPVPVAGNLTFQTVGAGLAHTCGVTGSGEAYCWGWNSWGVLGDGTDIGRLTPTRVAGALNWRFVGAGGSETCGLTIEGAAYCWGYNYPTGSLGQPPSEVHDSPVPVPVTGGLRFLWLEVGAATCGKTTVGLVYCWGANPFGQLGIGYYSIGNYQPVPIFGQQ